MAKSSGTSPAGAGGRSSAAIIDTVQRRSADRLAKVAFIWVWTVLTPTIIVIAATITHLWLAIALGVVAGLAVAVLVSLVVLVWPVLRMVWYWAGEILLLTGLLAGYLGLTRLTPWWAALLILVLVLGVPWAIRPSRRLLTAWIWCAMSRHRLRTCFATFIRVNRRGSIPLILLARPTPAGDRVWICLRPGLSLEDMTTEGGLARLAVGCWAHEVRLSRAWRRFAPLIRVDITRRNPLADTIVSPLTALVPDLVPDSTLADADGVDTVGTGSLVDFDPATLDLPGVPDTNPASATLGPAPAPAPRTKAATRTATKPPAQPAIVTRTGDDLSEWV